MEVFRGRPASGERPEPEREPRAEFVPPELEEMRLEEGDEILKRAEIRGDEYQGKRLTRELLEQEGLLPRYRIKIGGQFVWLASKAYDMSAVDAGYVGVVGYVEEAGAVVARTFIRSNSQGVWRYLPGYRTDSARKFSRFVKGYDEGSIALPFPLQGALASITGAGKEPVRVADAELVTCGTTAYITHEESATWLSIGDPRRTPAERAAAQRNLARFWAEQSKQPPDYAQQVADTPRRLAGNFYAARSDAKVRPEQLAFANPEQTPDFKKLLATWEQASELYRGGITAEVFPSRDGTLHYLFMRDREGRAWVSGVEDPRSPVQSVGLRRAWVAGGDLLTPAFEYGQQASGYGGMPRGKYVDMFRNYLSRVPVIREYLASVTARSAAPAQAERASGAPSPEGAAVAGKPASPEQQEQARRVSLADRLRERKAIYVARRSERLTELQRGADAGKRGAMHPSMEAFFDRGEALLSFLREMKINVPDLSYEMSETIADRIIDLFVRHQFGKI